jgi:type IV secretion system protein VirB1
VTLTAAAFVQLAAVCGPSVHVETLASVARAESGLDPLAIHDNTTGRTYRLGTTIEAVQLAGDLITVKRHSVDLGLMQVNSANLSGLGLSIADSFDPCKNIGAGARVLVASYQAPATGVDAQPALLQALSRYNTGRPDRGFFNGYVRRVQYAAGQIVPAIRLAGAPQSNDGAANDPAPLPVAPPPPPSWDVYAQARYARLNRGEQGRPPTNSASEPASPLAGTESVRSAPPVQLQATSQPLGDDR